MKILLVEDDDRIATFVAEGLAREGHAVEQLGDGRAALARCLEAEPDVAVVDRMLPGLDGLSLVRALRAAGAAMPVLVLTALDQVDQRVEGFRAGADDYLGKPFHFAELLARVEALGRRKGGAAPETALNVHDLTLDLVTHRATRAGQDIPLHAREYRLLELMMRQAGRVVTRSMLLDRVWNINFEPGTTVVETHVSRLRAKVDKPFDCALIHTVRNFGYVMHGPR
ncbi:response regulator transcription factor [Mangrovicoccus algicola]|uniref:Response regulator transcription factor n=1 Tax=Mangrovicoccus algicola TaxID=2771008 RepID=A0A8J6YUA6_9RHOB|nr:response regulator transcription factor [Mangrovicoccus algicola]MBE3639393.1 response regulator transcription factor [Mangrovicoccus algicola]